jgi:hypothetical protein
MKTTILNLTALVLLITTGIIAGHNNKLSNNISFPGETVSTEMAIDNTTFNHMVKAVRVGDEILPVVDLPTLEIEASYNRDNMVKAVIVDGEIMPFVQLPELTIEG